MTRAGQTGFAVYESATAAAAWPLPATTLNSESAGQLALVAEPRPDRVGSRPETAGKVERSPWRLGLS